MTELLTREAALEQVAMLERERRVADALLQVESLDLHSVLDRICRLTVELMPCDRATAYLYSNRARAFISVADCGTPPHVARRFAEKFFFGQSRAGGKRTIVPFREELVAGRFGSATRDDAATPEMRELLDALEQYAVCLIPLRSSARGAIFVSLAEPPGFDDTALRILQGVARQASNLVDHARTFQRLQHAARVRAGLAALVGFVAYVFVIMTYRLPIGTLAMVAALTGLVLQREALRVPAFLWLLLAWMAWAVLGYAVTRYPDVVHETLIERGKLGGDQDGGGREQPAVSDHRPAVRHDPQPQADLGDDHHAGSQRRRQDQQGGDSPGADQVDVGSDGLAAAFDAA